MCHDWDPFFGWISKAIFFVGLGVVSATLFALYIIACVQVAVVRCHLTELKSFRNPENRRVCTPEKKEYVLKPKM